MQDIKIAFFDIDGTLLSHKSSSVPQSTVRALRFLHDKGILIYAATGRHILELDELPLEGIPFDGYLILNGQLCLDKDRNILFGYPIAEDAMRVLADIFAEKKLPITIKEQDRMYINYPSERAKEILAALSTELPAVAEYSGAPAYQVCPYISKEEVPEEILNLPHVNITRWNPYGIDIVAEGGTKAGGIELILKHFGFTREQALAFGDGENDIEMLAECGTGICMGNGVEEAKAVADMVTEDIDEDGIEKALVKLGLIQA